MRPKDDWSAYRNVTPNQRKLAQDLLGDFKPINADYHKALRGVTAKILSECFSPPRQERMRSVCSQYIADHSLTIEDLLGHLYCMSEPKRKGGDDGRN